jgi:S-adenosylmethionine:tRNA ribosyltransferase-isomerase
MAFIFAVQSRFFLPGSENISMPDLFSGNLSISEFQYDLPQNRIARYPLEKRGASKLLVWRGGMTGESHYADIADWLPAPSLLVFNNSKVIAARLLFQKPSGGIIEIFCLEPGDAISGIPKAMMAKEKIQWKCLIGGASKWKKGMLLEKKTGSIVLQARFLEKETDSFLVEFSWTPTQLPFAAILHELGSIPLPPYLKRNAEAADAERYQTIFAAEEGSVAAPTAALHFTPEIFNSLTQKGIDTEYITLHVGAGTFMPVKSERLTGHIMHEEFIEVRAGTVQKLIDTLTSPIIAVGTTSLRTVESLYWLGLKVAGNKTIGPAALRVDQWDPYRMDARLSTKEALQFLLDWVRQQPDQKLLTKTGLFILPGYSFKIIGGLISNFHQPQSTLLLLVAALIGDEWKNLYRFALENDYRFLSYGDGCLLLPAG